MSSAKNSPNRSDQLKNNPGDRTVGVYDRPERSTRQLIPMLVVAALILATIVTVVVLIWSRQTS